MKRQEAVARREAHHRALISAEPTWAGRARKTFGYLFAEARRRGLLKELCQFLDAVIRTLQQGQPLPDIGQNSKTLDDPAAAKPPRARRRTH